jgi:hypothetical protein
MSALIRAPTCCGGVSLEAAVVVQAAQSIRLLCRANGTLARTRNKGQRSDTNRHCTTSATSPVPLPRGQRQQGAGRGSPVIPSQFFGWSDLSAVTGQMLNARQARTIGTGVQEGGVGDEGEGR